ncbi:MAG: ABC transporter permease [Thermomicrobiales bacterium]
MIPFIIRRLILIVPVMLIVGTITFLLLHVTPGDPAAVMLGPDATPAQVEQLRDDLGLDEPLLVQYPRWISNVVKFDLGRSIFLDRPVINAILERALPTLQLSLYALIIAIGLGVPAGVLAVLKRDTLLDRMLLILALSGTAIADFFLGMLLILLFAVVLQWFPSGGYVAFSADPVEHFRAMFLPSLALGISIAGLPARLIRTSMLDVIQEDYVKVAVSRGLSPWVVTTRHVLRNALIPAITVFGYTLGDLLGGAVVVETVFSLPGMGQLVVNSIARRDFPVIQGVVMVIAVAYLLANLLVDILYVAADPRVRVDRVSR